MWGFLQPQHAGQGCVLSPYLLQRPHINYPGKGICSVTTHLNCLTHWQMPSSLCYWSNRHLKFECVNILAVVLPEPNNGSMHFWIGMGCADCTVCCEGLQRWAVYGKMSYNICQQPVVIQYIAVHYIHPLYTPTSCTYPLYTLIVYINYNSTLMQLLDRNTMQFLTSCVQLLKAFYKTKGENHRLVGNYDPLLENTKMLQRQRYNVN